MSDEYIKKSDAINAVDRLCRWHEKDGSWLTSTDVIVAIKKIQPADVVERKRGEWIKHKERTEMNGKFIDFFPAEYECSNCGLRKAHYFTNSKPHNYCPNCGADMRGKDDE